MSGSKAPFICGFISGAAISLTINEIGVRGHQLLLIILASLTVYVCGYAAGAFVERAHRDKERS